MAGLTKEQRAQRDAEKLAAQIGAEQTPAQQEQPAIELVVMVRDAPEFPGGPLSADVHPDEVDNWLALDWRLEE
jgi:plasmid stabilization system protein ParE